MVIFLCYCSVKKAKAIKKNKAMADNNSMLIV